MAKKSNKLGVAAALAVGAGAAAIVAQKAKNNEKSEVKKAPVQTNGYRNTERGKYEKNSKGIYYSNGNYEAFARPRKPKNVDQKSAYIIGGGLAGLATAIFLVRDGQMSGEKIHIYEELPTPGGSLDGEKRANIGFVTRGGREMENHFETMWDMYRSIPSLEIEDASYLDEFYWLDKDDPNSSNTRLIYNRGQRVPTDGLYTLDEKPKELIDLILTPESKLGKTTIEEFFSNEFFESNF